MKKTIVVAGLLALLSGCMSNVADTANPAPTNLTGIYKAGFFGGSVTWQIYSDGRGVACEQRTSMSEQTKLRDMVVNGNTAYDVYEYKLSNISENGFKASGIMDLEFKKLQRMPAACK